MKDKAFLQNVLEISQEKLRSFEELPNFVAYFFDDNYAFDPDVLKKIQKHNPKERLEELQVLLSNADLSFDCESIEAALKALSAEKELSTGAYIHTLRFAVSGRGVGPSLYHMLVVLGREEVLKRIQRCLTTL